MQSKSASQSFGKRRPIIAPRVQPIASISQIAGPCIGDSPGPLSGVPSRISADRPCRGAVGCRFLPAGQDFASCRDLWACQPTNWADLLPRVAHRGRFAGRSPFGPRDLPNSVLSGRKNSFDNHPDDKRCLVTTVRPMREYSTVDSSMAAFDR